MHCDTVIGICSYDPPGRANDIELCCQPNGGPCELVKPGTCHSQIDLELRRWPSEQVMIGGMNMNQ